MTEPPDQELDLIAVGAHPDDVEIACGGTLARLVRKGYSVGIVDLTDGEPTPHSPGPDVRLAEAEQAAGILGVRIRINLNLPNRRLFDSFDCRVLDGGDEVGVGGGVGVGHAGGVEGKARAAVFVEEDDATGAFGAIG